MKEVARRLLARRRSHTDDYNQGWLDCQTKTAMDLAQTLKAELAIDPDAETGPRLTEEMARVIYGSVFGAAASDLVFGPETVPFSLADLAPAQKSGHRRRRAAGNRSSAA